ncbi:hypothetical protein SLA2020_063920 [Shorea laevis]
MMMCIHIGLLYFQENVANRPTMASVVHMLNDNSTTLVPSQPAFLLHRTTVSDISSSQTSKDKSLPLTKNDVSLTELYPR